MSLAKTILSRLFGSVADEDEIENSVPEVQEEEVPQPQPNPASLQLPMEHPLNKLWTLWSEQTGQTPFPELCLEGLPEQKEILSVNELERELTRLRQLVTSTASERAGKAVPKEEEPLLDRGAYGAGDSNNYDTAHETDALEGSSSGAGTQDKGHTEEEIQKKSRPDLDAQVVVFSAKSQMAAWLLVYPPVGQGKEVSRDMLVQALKENKVEFGVDTALFDKLPTDANRYFHLFFAAEGRPAVHGKDGYTIDRFPRKKQREMKVNEAGQVDYAELNIVNNADQGDVICQIVEPTEGVAGRNISNKELPAKDGKKVTVPKGRNTTLSEDGTALIATKPGHVEFDGRNFQVKPVMDIGKNVDYSTGNINFLGDIHIRGDVCSGFTVRAMGNITVDGVVEASTIEAGGDLIVVKGVKGNNQAVIKACGSIYAKYLESTVVCAQEELQTDCIINCDVYSDGQVQACSGRGIIIGGKIRASGEVKANIVGSKSECLTSVILGGHPSDDFEYENLIREIEELELEYEEIERQPDSPAKMRSLPMLRMKLSVNRTKLKQFETFIQEAKETPQNQEEIQDGRKLVCGIAYPGTEVTIGDVTHRLEHETQHCRAVLLDGEIHFL
ncbi:MAG: DUF342 domain-containing protein [Ruminococcus sp.]|nr:DUF342 domain-containing protein [Ruminococcus sp.]